MTPFRPRTDRNWQYVGEEGPDCPLKGAISVSNPFELNVTNKALQGSLLGKEVYQRAMGSAYHACLLILIHTRH